MGGRRHPFLKGNLSMILSTMTKNLRQHFSDRETIDILKEAGFDAIDYTLYGVSEAYNPDIPDKDSKRYFTEVRKYAEDKGIFFNQAHTPMPTSYIDSEKNDRRYAETVKAIKVASYLGIKNVVVHPNQHMAYYKTENAEKLFEINMGFYSSLLPLCEELGVIMCTENMWQNYGVSEKIWDSTCSRPEEMIRYIDSINSPYLKACLDLGHCVLVGQNPVDFIKKLGADRLACLHVHDNDGLHDNHTLPLHGVIDYAEIAKALGEIGYKGDLTLEADGFFTPNMPVSHYPEVSKYMAKVGRIICDMIEKA